MLGINKPLFLRIQFRYTGWCFRNGDNSKKITSLPGTGVEVNCPIILNVKILHYENVNTYDRN